MRWVLLLVALVAGTGCWHTAHQGPPPWPHVLTCYGGCQAPHYDPSACGGSTACCSKCIDGTWWYSTEQQIFGCGAKLELRHGNKCVVVQVADNGPASWVEANAAAKCGGDGDIIDTSPLVADYFGGGCGWSQCFWIEVRPVPKSMPQGICPTCPCGGECKPGEVQGQGCGKCGWQERVCGGDSKWGGWGACAGQGPCSPGQVEVEACGDCGSHARSCGGNCQWGGWEGCQGPDPGDGKLPCDTGEPGVCGPGLQKCLDGWVTCRRLIEPSDEVCDDMDNDCNGMVDDGAPQGMGQALPEFGARVDDFSFPMALPAGQVGHGWAEFSNVGTRSWNKGEIWLKAEGSVPGTPSPLAIPGLWPAYDVAAVLADDVAPGGLARLEFAVAPPRSGMAPGNQRFVLLGPDGAEMRCPAPGFELAVRSLGPSGWSLEPPEDGLQDAITPPDAARAEDEGVSAGGSPAGGCGVAGRPAFAWPLLGMVVAGLFGWRRRHRLASAAALGMAALLLAAACSSEPAGKPTDVVADSPGKASFEGLSPHSGTAQGGDVVVLSGSGFVEGMQVRFGEDKASSVELRSPDELAATTPPMLAGQLDVTVIWPDGTEATLNGAFQALRLELRFVDVPAYSFPGMAEMDTRSGAVGDLDKDGDPDLVLVSPGGPLLLLLNDGNGNFAQAWPPIEPPPEEPPDANPESQDVTSGPADVGGTDGALPQADAVPYPTQDVLSSPDLPLADASTDALTGDVSGEPADATTEPTEIPVYDARDVAIADLDKDGCLDVFVLSGPGGKSALLRGDCSGKLVDVTGDASSSGSGDGLSSDSGDFGRVAVADLNGDGRLDLLVSDLAPGAGPQEQNRVFLHDPSAAFVFAKAPDGMLPLHDESTSAITPVDVDRDGDLDLVLSNLQASDGHYVRLLLSMPGGFIDAPSGMLPFPPGATAQVVAGDVDGDDDPDLIAICVGGQDRLYRNDGSGFFFDDTLIAMPLDKSNGSAAVLRDLDRDGLVDLVIGNFMHQDRLYLNNGQGTFHDYTPLLPIAQQPTFGVLVLDADGDHDMDLVLLNGSGVANRLLLSVRP